MKIQILADDNTLQKNLMHEHGLSIYLECNNSKCLLDTGASSVFLQNAKEMGIDLNEVDFLFISHGHSDHIGGLLTFLKENSKAKVIIAANTLHQEYYSLRKGKRNISLKDDVNAFKDRFIFVEDECKMGETIHVFRNTSTSYPQPKANKTLMLMQNNELIQDTFSHELICTFGAKQVLAYSGCAHAGVLNIMQTIQKKTNKPIKILIGGFHLIDGDYETEEEISTIAKTLQSKYPHTQFMTGHCTGEKAYQTLKSKLKEKLNYFYTGYTYLDEEI